METSRRDVGLVRAVGTWDLAASTISIVVGAGIFVLPAALAAAVGAYAPFAVLVCALAVGSVAVCFAEGGSRIPSSGGAYAYVEAAFGALAGYVAGTLLWVGNVLACGSIAAALADAVAGLLPEPARVAARIVFIVTSLGGIALINTGGIVRAARLINAATLLKLAPLAIFIAAGAIAVHGANFRPTHRPDASSIGRALILGVYAFTGMEAALCASGEVARPARTIPRALGLALGSVTLLYATIQIVCQGILGTALAASKAPLADAMSRLGAPLQMLMLSGAAISMLGWLAADITSSPRMLYAFGRDGRLPGFVGRLGRRSRAPHVAIVGYAALAGMLAVSGTFAELAVLATLASGTLYIAGCAAAWCLAKRGVTRAGEPLNFRWLGAATIVGIGAMLLLIGLASREEVIGLLALIFASCAVYLIQARMARRSRILDKGSSGGDP